MDATPGRRMRGTRTRTGSTTGQRNRASAYVMIWQTRPVLISRSRALLAAALLTLPLTGCSSGQADPKPTPTPVRHHVVTDLCPQLGHDRLEKLTGTPVKFAPVRPARDDSFHHCQLGAGRVESLETIGQSTVGIVQITTRVFGSESEGRESRPDAAPTGNGDAIRGEVEGIGDYAWFTYFDDPDSPTYTLNAQESDALVTVNLAIRTPTPVERSVVEEICRAYVEEILTLMRN